MDEERRQFILDEHAKYAIIANRIANMRQRLDQGHDPAEILLKESDAMLASNMTREQLAAALVSTMLRVAAGEYTTPERVHDAAMASNVTLLTWITGGVDA